MIEKLHKIPSVDELLETLGELQGNEADGPVLSIYCKTGQLPDDAAKARIRFKNALSEATEISENTGSEEFGKSLKKLKSLIEDDHFWNHQGGGLAVFLRGEEVSLYQLEPDLPNEVVLAPSYYLKPLLAIAANADVFYLLAVSQKKVALHRVSGLGTYADVCSEIPQGYEDAMNEIGYLEDSDAIKGAKSEWKVDDKYLKKYFEQIDKAVSSHLNGQSSPLILACVEEYAPIYREVNTYGHLSNEVIGGNPEHEDLRDLADKGRSLLHSELIESQRLTLNRYKNARANDLSVEGLEALFREAESGNLEAVFLPGDASLWGTRSDQKITEGDSALAETSDLYESAALAALNAGAEIYFLDKAQLPTESKVIGIKRWVSEAPTSAHSALGVE